MDIHQELSELAQRLAELEASVDRRLGVLEERAARSSVAETGAVAGPPTMPPSRVTPGAMPPPPLPGDAVSLPPPSPGFAMAPVPEVPSAPRALPEFDVETMLRWVGVALVTLAGVFLVSTAVTRGWIGPELQLIAAALAGAGLLAGSVYLADSRRPWSMAFGGGGSIVLIASAVASHQWKDMVSGEVSLVLVGFALAACIGVALHTRFDSIATIAGLVAVLGPLDTLDEFGEVQVLAWTMALLVGSTALGLTRRWVATRLLVGWVSAIVLVVLAFVVDDRDLINTYGYAALVLSAAALWLGPVLADKLDGSGQGPAPAVINWKALDLRTVGVVPGLAFLGLVGLVDPDTNDSAGIIGLCVGLFFVGVAAASWPWVSKIVSMTSLLAAFGVGAVGLALWLDGPVLMVALAVQAALSYYVGRALKDTPMRLGGYVLGIISSAIAVEYMADAVQFDGFESPGDLLATLVVVGAWIAAAYATYRSTKQSEISFEVLFAGAWIGTMAWVSAALTAVPEGLSLISGVWAVMACVGLIVGLRNRIDAVRVAGLLTLGITLVKLLSVDLAEVDVLVRVALFFAIGVGLIVLGLKVPSLIRMGVDDAESSTDESAGL